jgi:very-short-patch-repair endonuclease
MDAHLQELAENQADTVAAWQLLAAGWTRRMVDDRSKRHGWRVVHRGVYALSAARLTRRQRWIAATLSAPDCWLSHASAGGCWGFRRFEGSFETVTRPGSGGPTAPRRPTRVPVAHPRRSNDGARWDQTTTAARTVIDLAAHLDHREARRIFREALRLKATTLPELQSALSRHPRRRGTKLIGELAARYSAVPYARSRSDAESRALELLHDARVEPPRVNTRIAGEEADLAWPDRRPIIEIDGPQYHLFPEEDARKELRWKAAGYTVHRVGSDVVYHQPERFLSLQDR